MQRKSQPEQTSESISNTLTSFSITGSNLNFAKKSLIRDDNGSSKKIISCINDGFYELKKILDKVF